MGLFPLLCGAAFHGVRDALLASHLGKVHHDECVIELDVDLDLCLLLLPSAGLVLVVLLVALVAAAAQAHLVAALPRARHVVLADAVAQLLDLARLLGVVRERLGQQRALLRVEVAQDLQDGEMVRRQHRVLGVDELPLGLVHALVARLLELQAGEAVVLDAAGGRRGCLGTRFGGLRHGDGVAEVWSDGVIGIWVC